MALEPIEQFNKAIQDVKSPILFLPENPDGDVIGSAWAFAQYFQKRGIEPTIAFSDPFDQKKKYTFLKTPSQIISSIKGVRDFVLIFNTKYNKISNVRTEEGNDELCVYLTPEKSAIDPRDFSFVPARCKYDIAILFGCSDKESLGRLYEENADILYEIPIVNIDCHSNNDAYGQINIVDVVASSVSEVSVHILNSLEESAIDEDMAQCLLTGIISATDSYQRKNTTPKALHVSAKLIEKGADQQTVVRYLYKTQPFSILKLWGRIMANLQWDEETGFVWARVTLDDFVQSRTSPKDLFEILDKIKGNYSAGKVFMLLYQEEENAVSGIMKAINEDILKKLTELYKGDMQGSCAKFSLSDTTLEKAEKEIIGKLSK